jgi:SAM-dependent methyltransferase
VALREIRRVLKPGGRFLLDDIVSVADYTVDTHLQAIELLRDPSHVRDHPPAEWLALLAEAGFVAELVYAFPCRLNFVDWTQRMATPAPEVALLRERMAAAPAEVRIALEIDDAGEHFTIPGALFVARV